MGVTMLIGVVGYFVYKKYRENTPAPLSNKARDFYNVLNLAASDNFDVIFNGCGSLALTQTYYDVSTYVNALTEAALYERKIRENNPIESRVGVITSLTNISETVGDYLEQKIRPEIITLKISEFFANMDKEKQAELLTPVFECQCEFYISYNACLTAFLRAYLYQKQLPQVSIMKLQQQV